MKRCAQCGRPMSDADIAGQAPNADLNCCIACSPNAPHRTSPAAQADALAALTIVQATFADLSDRADAAFRRYFAKRQAGTPTNGAAYSHLTNLANYASADRASAISKVYQAFGDDDRAADAAITAICGSNFH